MDSWMVFTWYSKRLDFFAICLFIQFNVINKITIITQYFVLTMQPKVRRGSKTVKKKKKSGLSQENFIMVLQ